MIINISLEVKNFIKVCFKCPIVLVSIIPDVLHLFLLNINRKIKKIIRFISSSSPALRNIEKYRSILHLNKLPDINIPGNSDIGFTKIRLATEVIPVNYQIDWLCLFNDCEDSFSLNRFGWLLAALVENPSTDLAQKALFWMDDWIEKMHKNINHPAWESYSVAERLSNWPFILHIVRKLCSVPDDLLNKISQSMSYQLDYLVSHIEYTGKFTNNHILNSARGLYIGGIILDNKPAVITAKEIFEKWTGKLFHPDGMLKEHSSHYQFLLCQRYEQIYLMAKNIEDNPFTQFIKNWVTLMQEACDFFSVYDPKNGSWDMPLIGDISPDFSPRWLSPSQESGWMKFKKMFGYEILESKPGKERYVIIIKKGDFIRYNAENIVIFWHIDTDRSSYVSHGHFDVGGFILFYNGKQVIADPGRFSYTTKGSYGKSAKAHSTLMVDSFGADCENHRLNSLNAYKTEPSSYTYTETCGYFDLEIHINGFNRLANPVQWKRSFHIKKDGMTITDSFENYSNNLLETRFQIAPGIQVKKHDNNYLILLYESSVSVSLIVFDSYTLNLSNDCLSGFQCSLLHGNKNKTDDGEGWFSNEYGNKADGTTVMFRRRLGCERKQTYELRWK